MCIDHDAYLSWRLLGTHVVTRFPQLYAMFEKMFDCIRRFLGLSCAFLIVSILQGQDVNNLQWTEAESENNFRVLGYTDYVDQVQERIEILTQEYPDSIQARFDHLTNCARTLLGHGYYDQAINFFKVFRADAISVKDTLAIMWATMDEGNAYLFKGDFHESIQILNHGYGLLISSRINDPSLHAYFPHLIGTAHYYLDEYDDALHYFDRALPVMQDQYHPFLRLNYNYTARVLTKLGKYKEALVQVDLGEQFYWDHYISLYGADSKCIFHSSRARGDIYARQGRYKDAIAQLNQAEKEVSTDGNVFHLLAAIPMYEKALIHVDFGNLKGAREESNRALHQLGIEEWEKFDFTTHPNLQYVLSTLIALSKTWQLHLKKEDTMQMRFRLDALYQSVFQVIELLLQDFSIRRGSMMMRRYDHIYADAVENSYQLYGQYKQDKFLLRGLTCSDNNKSQEVRRSWLQKQDHRAIPDSIQIQLIQAKTKLNGLKRSLLEAQVSKDQEATARYTADYEQLRATINYLSGTEIDSGVKVSEREDISNPGQFLADHEAIIGMFESEDVWHMWEISTDGIVWSRHAKSTDWNDVVYQFLADIGGAYDFTSLLEPLSFLGNALCRLQYDDITHLTFIADKNLSTIPIELLLTDCHNGDRVMSISYGYTVRNHKAQNSEPSYEHNVIAWAPTYQVDTSGSTHDEMVTELVRSGRYNLPGAQAEARGIIDITGGLLLSGVAASKASFIDHMNTGRVLHLSMHALMNQDDANLSKFLFSNAHLEDKSQSYLHAFELEEMSLQAELAVLSACETGLGIIEKGEGVMSLARSFAMAGVPSTIMSLWKIPDNSSSLIMTHYYKHLTAGLGKSSALLKAKEDYLTGCVDPKLKHPYYWAGFVLIGDNEPIFKVPTSRNWALFSFLLLMIVTIGWCMRRRILQSV